MKQLVFFHCSPSQCTLPPFCVELVHRRTSVRTPSPPHGKVEQLPSIQGDQVPTADPDEHNRHCSIYILYTVVTARYLRLFCIVKYTYNVACTCMLIIFIILCRCTHLSIKGTTNNRENNITCLLIYSSPNCQIIPLALAPKG